MRNPRIHLPQPMQADARVELNETAANHVARVLRMKAGDPLVLFDGEGNGFQARVDQVEKRRVQVVIESVLESATESPLSIHLGQVMSRGDRMDWAIQKATEMGVTEITPLLSERCEVKLSSDRADKRQQHWQQVAISACEQCGRNRVPRVHPPRPLTQWASEQNSDLKLVLHHRTEQSLSSLSAPRTLSLLIGPEGGLSPLEIEQSLKLGFRPTALGPRVLRTETAPVAALALAQYLWGDIG
ncbi:16S rRNA (uracil(1498)-N(3))-methyltransferase [Aestuariirhabdus litorea]|uniref:Ribosomal RNA small subunit methyltransferase E n=1 Tax=Aestuariirhabdus litorea TaxID=2528527 RepID=A0A3P3VL75_9GAMM|nr:16S rRNA (uracil(1498)-N(3))-methyltransferase [Aestuariirhabdus litorea]RRJ83502.1 16S rRNA (uracil(1498)-N(3))-methyltransferase [Aestuariirhabdus litorea]RWW92881.1 16S rRNA (uracil(1498)-N(3))-methyltransferase [Endozoicomonadaceae bacterium GTF-13]